ncbi:MAG TPA: 1-acyl-sn-glycerol-3-phosphate acyltransferase [Methylomirabilota bacterium]|nr:1-acyl-sn-glycerol-3-phosphate acyltransferase [Methylomirabilota bacterium]
MFYRRVDVIGAERIPRAGPVIVAANHHNALVDGVLLLALVPRRLVSVAKAPLFSNPLVGPFLRLIGALPVHRRQEGGTDPARNAALFEASSSTLRSGQAILIFPEGVSQPEPTLMPLRTGAARMLLAAEADGVGPVTLLPVGLMFHEPGTFRTGWALVSIGEPVATADCAALARSAPEEAARRLTARLGEAMRGLIALVDDRQTLRLVEHAERLWRQERGGEWDATARADWRRRATRAYRYLSRHDPGRLSRLRGQMERYIKDLDAAGLRTAVLLKPPAPGVALRYAGGQLAALLGGLPLALWGLASHALPYWLTWAAARLLRPSGDVEATYKLVAGVALYPLAWIGEAWLLWWVGGGGLLALFLALLVPGGFFALSWSERLRRLYGETRALLRLVLDRDLARHLAERRREILAEMDAAVARVPEPVLDGREEVGA